MALKKNIFLITIDCFRADYLNNTHTPFLHELSRKGISIGRFFAEGPGTPIAFISLFTSTYPLMFNGYRELTPPRTPIVEVLSKSKYLTIGIHDNPFLSRFFGFHRGFKIFVDLGEGSLYRKMVFKKRHPIKKTISKVLRSLKVLGLIKALKGKKEEIRAPYASAEIVVKTAINKLQQSGIKERVFLWMHFMDAHAPFNIREEYLERLNPKLASEMSQMSLRSIYKDTTLVKLLYSSQLLYVDAQVREFIHYLEDKGYLENGILIVVGDHGEEFREHGEFGHNPKLYRELLHVPFIAQGVEEDLSAIKSGKEIAYGHVNIAPTILSMCGLETPKTYVGEVIGRKTLPYVFSEVAHSRDNTTKVNLKIAKYSVIKYPYHLILDQEKGTVELYDMERDPQERRNILGEEKDLANELLKVLNRHLLREKLSRIRMKYLALRSS
ncbi:MAG: hypothetical protein DRJ59_06150 [Thermoprotei archaeon]|nr:MAG: hypothetical protein DRJ59_06150 [Thermoprotei archaeon]